VQAAIERAKANREGADSIDPKPKLLNDIASLEKRITTTQEKIKTAETEGSDTVDVLKTSAVKLQDKLDAARQQLDQLG
jgi:electron transport complex protein RnfC